MLQSHTHNFLGRGNKINVIPRVCIFSTLLLGEDAVPGQQRQQQQLLARQLPQVRPTPPFIGRRRRLLSSRLNRFTCFSLTHSSMHHFTKTQFCILYSTHFERMVSSMDDTHTHVNRHTHVCHTFAAPSSPVAPPRRMLL